MMTTRGTLWREVRAIATGPVRLALCLTSPQMRVALWVARNHHCRSCGYECPSARMRSPPLWEASHCRHAGAGRGPREGAPALSGARLVDRAEAGESGRDLHLPTPGRCLIDARLSDPGPLHGIHRRQAMKAKLLLILLAVAIASGSMTHTRRKAPPQPRGRSPRLSIRR